MSRLRQLSLGILVTTALAIIWFSYVSVQEPVYRDKSISFVLKELDARRSRSSRAALEQAITEIGTNAFPHLAKEFSFKESRIERWAVRLVNRLASKPIRFRSEVRKRRAIEAFWIMGTLAHEALSSPDDGIRLAAYEALQGSGVLTEELLRGLVPGLYDPQPRIRELAYSGIASFFQVMPRQAQLSILEQMPQQSPENKHLLIRALVRRYGSEAATIDAMKSVEHLPVTTPIKEAAADTIRALSSQTDQTAVIDPLAALLPASQWSGNGRMFWV